MLFNIQFFDIMYAMTTKLLQKYAMIVLHLWCDDTYYSNSHMSVSIEINEMIDIHTNNTLYINIDMLLLTNGWIFE